MPGTCGVKCGKNLHYTVLYGIQNSWMTLKQKISLFFATESHPAILDTLLCSEGIFLVGIQVWPTAKHLEGWLYLTRTMFYIPSIVSCSSVCSLVDLYRDDSNNHN